MSRPTAQVKPAQRSGKGSGAISIHGHPKLWFRTAEQGYGAQPRHHELACCIPCGDMSCGRASDGVTRVSFRPHTFRARRSRVLMAGRKSLSFRPARAGIT